MDRNGVSYYRGQRVSGENTRPVRRLRSVSPVFDAPDGAQAGFNGDYSGLTISRGVEAHPIWSDTRNADPFSPANGVVHDEDVFTATANLPNGKGHAGQGRIGRH